MQFWYKNILSFSVNLILSHRASKYKLSDHLFMLLNVQWDAFYCNIIARRENKLLILEK